MTDDTGLSVEAVVAAALGDTGADPAELAAGLRRLLDVLPPVPSSAADAVLRDRLEAALQQPYSRPPARAKPSDVDRSPRPSATC